MNDYIPLFYMDVITYLNPNPNAGLANLLVKKPQGISNAVTSRLHLPIKRVLIFGWNFLKQSCRVFRQISYMSNQKMLRNLAYQLLSGKLWYHGACFTNYFSLAIKICWKFHFSPIQLSQQLITTIFAHFVTTLLLGMCKNCSDFLNKNWITNVISVKF